MPPVVEQVVGSAGSPLPAGLRADMEARLGAEFGGVRVHTDAQAARSAAAVGARAYALGRDVVFGSGQFQPDSAAGRRLLAHELVHVAQQPVADLSGPVQVGAADSEHEREADRLSASALAEAPGAASPHGVARGSVLRRQPAGQAPPAAPPAALCSADQRQAVAPRLATAQQWLRKANQGLSQLVAGWNAVLLGRPGGAAGGGPAAQSDAQVTQALLDHFKTNDGLTVAYIIGVLGQIAARVDALNASLGGAAGGAPGAAAGAPVGVSVECHTEAADTICQSAGAYVLGPLMVFCQSYFRGDADWQAETIVHEIAHSLDTPKGMHITDRGYQSQRIYKDLTRDEALTNAESYALFVQQLGQGTPARSTAPSDTAHDCPPDWKPAVSKAAEEAERWNRNALTVISNRSPEAIAAHAAEYDLYLGGHDQARVEKAAKAFQKTEDAFGSGVDFECEPKGGGRCSSKQAETYWYSIWSNLHICPIWLVEQPDDRTEGILAGMYGFEGDVDSSDTRRKLAQLAKAFTRTVYAVPTPEEVANALNPPPIPLNLPPVTPSPNFPAGHGQGLRP